MILSDQDPKKLAALILVKKGKDGAPDESKSMERKSDMDVGLVSAADEMLAAVEKKDTEGFAMALKDFISMCGDYSDQEEASEGE